MAYENEVEVSSVALESLERVYRMGTIVAEEQIMPYRRRANGINGVGHNRYRTQPRDKSSASFSAQQSACAYDHGYGLEPITLNTSVAALAEVRGWTTSLKVGLVVGQWAEIVGADVAAHCAVESFEPPVLVVRASSTTWATQLRIMQGTIMEKLHARLGNDAVEDIKILGPTQRSFSRGRRSVRGRGPRDTFG